MLGNARVDAPAPAAIAPPLMNLRRLDDISAALVDCNYSTRSDQAFPGDGGLNGLEG
jgi:hypothetical protein